MRAYARTDVRIAYCVVTKTLSAIAHEIGIAKPYHVYTDSADTTNFASVTFFPIFWVGSGDEGGWDPCCAFTYGGVRFWSGIFTVGLARHLYL